MPITLTSQNRLSARSLVHSDVHLFLQADKHSLVDTLGIPYRDLRTLDPMVRL